jgi:hypothetical protein
MMNLTIPGHFSFYNSHSDCAAVSGPGSDMDVIPEVCNHGLPLIIVVYFFPMIQTVDQRLCGLGFRQKSGLGFCDETLQFRICLLWFARDQI